MANDTFDWLQAMQIHDSYTEPHEALLPPFAGNGAGGNRVADVMRDELYHAVLEAKYELEVLPRTRDGALLGLYAVMDDLVAAIRRTEAMDRPVRAQLLGGASVA